MLFLFLLLLLFRAATAVGYLVKTNKEVNPFADFCTTGVPDGIPNTVHVFFFVSHDVLDTVRRVFREEIARGMVAFELSSSLVGLDAVHCAPLKVDRSCLVKPPVPPSREATPYKPPEPIEQFNAAAAVEFINTRATLFRQLDGRLTAFGAFMAGLGGPHLHGPHSATFSRQCDRIPFASLIDTAAGSTGGVGTFVHDYLLRQRPVIITGFPTAFGATNGNGDGNGTLLELLLSRHGDDTVGVKLSPSADFEGVDRLDAWGMAATQAVPPDVLRRMEAPHLVVVRPHHEDMKVGHVLDLIRDAGAAKAYVEYLPLTHMRLPGLLARLLPLHRLPQWLGFPTGDTTAATRQQEEEKNQQQQPPPTTTATTMPPLLRQGKAHAWLGDGHTVGKLHFDAFDNLLVQVVGAKTFYLLPTDPATNARLREGHMREAVLGANVTYRRRADGRVLTHDEAALLPHTDVAVSATDFRKHTLSESTSMVHSPVPVTFADHAGNATIQEPHMECRVEANEALFVPSFWWHEVASTPGQERLGGMPYNFAVNVWWAPLFDKEFPCPSCPKSPNFNTYMDTFRAIHNLLPRPS